MKKTALERFERKFIKKDGCWIWEACKIPSGYGLFYMNETVGAVNSHRASWTFYRGAIPEGVFVCHNCPGGDNPSCVNPDHLFLGTHDDNMRDKVEKERQAEGESHGLAKLTDTGVRELRFAAANGISPILLGRIYGIDRTNVHSVATRKTWDHVTGTLDEDEQEELLAVLHEQEKVYREEVSEKCRQGAAKTAEILRGKRVDSASKKCSICNQDKPVDDFYMKDKQAGRRFSWCKICHCIKTGKNYHDNLDEGRRKRLEYARKNQDKNSASKRIARERKRLEASVNITDDKVVTVAYSSHKNIILSVIGPHAGEEVNVMLARKQRDIEQSGQTFWMIRSYPCRPQVIQSHCVSGTVQCYLLEPAKPGGAVPTTAAQAAQKMSADGVTWSVMPDRVSPVTGNLSGAGGWALVLSSLVIPENEVFFNLASCNDIATGKAVAFRQGASTLCVQQLPKSEKELLRKVVAIGTLTSPFGVWLR